jgi:CRP-like cAMP-binding protein
MRPVDCEQDEVLVHAGRPSRHIYLIREGLLRLYYTTPDGKERNKAFYSNGEITGAVSAALTAGDAPFSIQALEPSLLIRADFDSLRSHVPDQPQVSELFIKLLAGAFIRNEQREAMLLTRNAEQRYQWLQENEPELLGRVAQFHLASYIGVDAVSLSRLKRKLDAGSDDAR